MAPPILSYEDLGLVQGEGWLFRHLDVHIGPRDQDRAFRATKEGRAMPLPQIERRVLPRMGGADYLGPELRGRTLRMKFMDNGKVIWVDVDPRTGRILGKSGD